MSKIIESGIYLAAVDISFEQLVEYGVTPIEFYKKPRGIIEIEILKNKFTLDFDTMIITKCNTGEFKSFIYTDGTVCFGQFRL